MKRNFLLMLLLTLLPVVAWGQTDPTKKTGLVYNGTAQDLVDGKTQETVGSWFSTTYYWHYAVVADGATKPGRTESNVAIPKATNAGDYDVYWVRTESSSAPSSSQWSSATKFDVHIEKAVNNILSATMDDYAVGDPVPTPSCTADYGAGTATFAYSESISGPWSSTAPTSKGTYCLQVTIPESANYKQGQAAYSNAFKVGGKASATGLSLQSGLKYNDGEQSLIAGTPVFPADYETSTGGIEYQVKTVAGAPGYAETGDATATAKDAGLYYVYYRVKADGDVYTINGDWTQVGSTGVKISKREITADDFTFAAVSGDLTFNKAAQKLAELTWTNDKDRGTVEYTVNGGPAVAVAEGTDANTYTVTATITPDGNHTFAGSITPVEKKIEKATVAFDPDDVASCLVTPDPTYNGSDIKLLKNNISWPEACGNGWTGTYTYYVNGTNVGSDWNDVVGQNAGEYVITFDYVPSSSNVQFTGGTQTAGKVTIKKAANSITNTPALVSDKVYNAAAQELIKTEPTATFGTVKYYIEDETTAITTAADVKKTDAGEYKVYYEVDGGNNYESIAKTQFPGNLGTIKPAEILVTAQKFDKVYDQVAVDKKNFFLGKNFVGGETPEKQLEILEQLVKVEGYDKTEAGSYTVTLSAVSPAPANNYKVDEVWVAETKLTIAPAPITVTADDNSKIFGEKDPEFTATAATLVGTDKLEDLNLEFDRAKGEDADHYAITVKGTNKNYDFTYVDGDFEIKKKPVAPAAPTAVADLVYNGDAQVLVTPAAAEDLEGVTATAWTVNGSAVATAADVKGTDAATYTVGYTYTLDPNYTLALDAKDKGTVDVEIAKKAVAPVAPTAVEGLVYTGADQVLITPAPAEKLEGVTATAWTVDGTGVASAAEVKGNAAATYTVGYEYTLGANYTLALDAKDKGTVEVTIGQKLVPLAPPTFAEGLIYNSEAQVLATAVKNEGVAATTWTINGETVAEDAIKGTDAGTYTVGYKYTLDANYAPALGAKTEGAEDVEIAQKLVPLAPPTAIADLVYNGEAQTLVTPVVNEGVTATAWTVNEKAVAEDAVEGTDAGTYTVGYKYTLDPNYNIELGAKLEGTVTVDIDQKPVTPTAPKAHALTYNGLPQALVDAGFAEGATIQYAVDGGEFADEVPEAKDAATYNVSYKFTVDPNYTFGNALEEGSFDVKLNPASITYSLGNQTVTYTGSAATPKENEAYQITNGALMVGDGDAFTFEFTEINATDANENGVPFTKLKTIWKDENVQNYAIQFNLTGKLFIQKAEVEVTAPEPKLGLAFNDANQQLMEAAAYAEFNGEAFDFIYSGNGISSSDFTKIVAKEAGEYEISWKVNDPGKNFKFVDADKKDAAEGTIKAKIDAKKAWDAEVPAFADGDIVETYNGTDFAKALDPMDFRLSDGNKVLTAVQDYTVEVNEKALGTMLVDKVGTIYNIKTAEIKNAGVYTVTYKGVANYAGLTEEYTIEVLPKDIAEFETKDFENIPQATGLEYDKKKDNYVEPVVKYVVSKESTLTLVKATDKQDNDYTLAVTKAGEEVTEVRNAGAYVYTFNGKGNYTGTKEFFVNIKKAELIVIAPNATKTYDATTAVEDDEFEELTYSGLQKGDHVDLGELKVVDVVTVPANAKNVGEYTLTIDVTEFPEQENYEISKTNTLPGTLTINPAAPVKISFSKDAKFGKQYSQKDNLNFTAADLVVNEGDGELFDGLAKAAPLLVLSREEGEDVGDYTLNINFATTPKATAEAAATFKKNYEDVTFGTGTFTIVPLEAALKVSIAATSSTYNGKAPQLAWADDLSNMVVTGLPAGKDKAGIFTTLPTITIVDDDDNVVTDATANAGEYNIQLSGGVSKNYTTVAIIGSYYTIEPVAVEAEFNTIPVAAVGVPAKDIMDQVTFTVKAVNEEDEATLAANMDKFEAQWTDLAALVDKDGKIKETANGKDALVIAYTGKEAEANFVIENAPVYGSLNIGTEGGEIALNDGENIVTYASEGTTVKFSNSRAIPADTWQACVLPCKISIQEFSKAFGYAAIDVLDEERTQGDEIHFSLKVTGDIEPGVPFLFKANGNVDNFKKITLNDVDVASTAALVEKGDNVVTDPDNNVKFIGTFETVNLTTSGYRYISGGKWYNTKDGYAKPYVIKPLRAYLDLTEMTSAADARIFIEEPDGTETAIDAIEFANDINGESIYTVDGKKVSKAAQKGIYIQNGKKVAIK